MKKMNKLSVSTYLSIILQCKCTKCSNQMTESALMDRNQDPYKCCQQELHFRFKDTD